MTDRIKHPCGNPNHGPNIFGDCWDCLPEIQEMYRKMDAARDEWLKKADPLIDPEWVGRKNG